MSSKQEFADWLSHSVTKTVMEALTELETDLTEELVISGGINPLQDRYRSGYIAALRDIRLIKLEDKEKHD